MRVKARYLLELGEGHDGLAALSRGGGHQEGLLGGHGGGGQVRGADLLCHQLLLDFVDQDQVVQLMGEEGREDGIVHVRLSSPLPKIQLGGVGRGAGPTWLGMVGGGGQKYGLLKRGSAILWGKKGGGGYGGHWLLHRPHPNPPQNTPTRWEIPPQ